MTGQPLDLHAIADTLGVGFYRVRRWRDNALKERPLARRLPDPDVSPKRGNPLWSWPVIKTFAENEGLWPPGCDQYICSVCKGTYSVYDNGTIRPHGWTDDGQGVLWECEGSSRMPAGKAPKRELEGATR